MEEAIITTSWDDGHPLDLKLAELLKRYDIPATFYIPVENVERESMSPDEIREIGAGFDVGGHTYHHVNLCRLSPEDADKEITEGKDKLEEIVGNRLKAFCYPKGIYSSETIDIVRRAGFIGARTVQLLTRRVVNPYEVGTTIIAADYRATFYLRHALKSRDARLFFYLWEKGLFFRGWDSIAIRTLDFVVKNSGVWHLWGHSWEIEKNSDWGRLERVLSEINVLAKGVMKVNNSQLMEMYAGKES